MGILQDIADEVNFNRRQKEEAARAEADEKAAAERKTAGLRHVRTNRPANRPSLPLHRLRTRAKQRNC